eukprot:g47892.t1
MKIKGISVTTSGGYGWVTSGKQHTSRKQSEAYLHPWAGRKHAAWDMCQITFNEEELSISVCQFLVQGSCCSSQSHQPSNAEICNPDGFNIGIIHCQGPNKLFLSQRWRRSPQYFTLGDIESYRTLDSDGENIFHFSFQNPSAPVIYKKTETLPS